MLVEIVKLHRRNPSEFRWQEAEVGTPVYRDQIANGDINDDVQLIEEHRAKQYAVSKQYKQMFAQLRPQLEKAFIADGTSRPKTFREFIRLLIYGKEKLLAGFGKTLYDAAGGTDISKDDVLSLYQDCPPLRAFNYALLMSWFNLAVRHQQGDEFKAGRNDLFMSIYLPYCHIFVTAENGREQEKCLSEIASVAGLQTEVVSYDGFRARLLSNSFAEQPI
jgi:hypothetical protein